MCGHGFQPPWPFLEGGMACFHFPSVLTMSLISCNLRLCHLSFAEPRGTTSPRVSQFLQAHSPNKYQPTEPTAQLLPLSGSHALGHCPPDLITPGSGTKQLGTVLVPQSLLKLFQLDNSKPVFYASPIPSCRNYNKGSFPPSSFSLYLLTAGASS